MTLDEHNCEVDGHEWEFQDDSFTHEFGTEVIHYFTCKHCDASRGMEESDYYDDDPGEP